MAKVAIRPASADKNVVLHEKYTVDDVVAEVEEASAAGKNIVIFESNGGGHVVVSIGGTEPFTIREARSGSVVL